MEIGRLSRSLLITLLLTTGLSMQGQGQNFLVKYLNHTLKDTSDPAKPKFIAYPTLAFAPETSWEFGVSGLLVYRAKQDTLNRLSEVKTFSFVTLEQQYGTMLDHALYTDKNRFFLLGELKFQNFPLSYFGIGPEARAENPATVHAVELKFRERFLYQFAPSLFTGFELDFQRLAQVDFEWPDGLAQSNPLGSNGSANLSLGWGILYDNLHNVLNPRHGKYLELAFLNSNTRWGSGYSFNLVVSDFRFYTPIKKRNVLAIQAYGQFGTGDLPFNQLSLMGGERLMRGYYLGRYRDKNIMAGQVEYRMLPFSFAKRWGASVFASAGSVFPSFNQYTQSPIVWAAGFGPRFLIFPKKDVYNRFDVAFTSEGMGFYFFIGEAF
ncbi:MAG: BamA/TamA family outer membrane protein [Bacteroidia bacterium]|nr:BamA/TamA family outer membrane protein [Bacteroidia bacterium]